MRQGNALKADSVIDFQAARERRQQGSTPDWSGLDPGDRIFHPKFGHGVVVRPNGRVLVADFVGRGLKRVMLVHTEIVNPEC
jgi:hypothetical protein